MPDRIYPSDTQINVCRQTKSRSLFIPAAGYNDKELPEKMPLNAQADVESLTEAHRCILVSNSRNTLILYMN